MEKKTTESEDYVLRSVTVIYSYYFSSRSSIIHLGKYPLFVISDIIDCFQVHLNILSGWFCSRLLKFSKSFNAQASIKFAKK